MNKISFLCASSLMWATLLAQTTTTPLTRETMSLSTRSASGNNRLPYPESKKENTVLTLHGQTIPDPYAWLEAPAETPAVKQWIQKQQTFTEGHFQKMMFRESIRLALAEKWDYPKHGVPMRKKGRLYYNFNPGLLNQSKLMMQNEQGLESLVLDPNTFSEDGTASLATYSISEDGNHLAYAISEAGSDWRTIKVLHLPTMQLTSDLVENVKFSGIAWQGNGFYYSRFPRNQAGAFVAENAGQQVFYHTLGTPQSKDELIFEDKNNPKHGNYGYTVSSEKLLVISQTKGTHGNRIWVKPTGPDMGKKKFIPLIQDFSSESNVVAFENNQVYLLTNHKAPNHRLIRIDLNKPQEKDWKEVIPAGDGVLQAVYRIPNGWMALYNRNVKNELVRFQEGAQPQTIQLPAMGTIAGVSVEEETGEAFFALTSFHMPATIYRLSPGASSPEKYKASGLDIDAEKYEVKQVRYASKDGTVIPMYLFYKKDMPLENRACLLYGYGGFNIPVMPSFSLVNWLFVESGGVYAVPALRGGGEFGEEWHTAGMLEKKQNVFDDFIGAAEYLIEKGITSPARLAIHGRSNGGLLVGACMLQRPDLFKVAIPAVGVLDMLKFHQFTIGHAWMVEYGNPEDPAHFPYIFKYSPLHQIKQGKTYPATLIMTADHDDRVVPAHSFKFAAALQAAQQGMNPILIRIESNAGHGAGKSTAMVIQDYTDFLAFLFTHLAEKP
jgi:prolyl oligopeptidase